jgi:hypothetical protein
VYIYIYLLRNYPFTTGANISGYQCLRLIIINKQQYKIKMSIIEDKHKIVLHLSIFYEYQQFFQHRICFSIQPPDYSDPWPRLARSSSFFLIMLFKDYGVNFNTYMFFFTALPTVVIQQPRTCTQISQLNNQHLTFTDIETIWLQLVQY